MKSKVSLKDIAQSLGVSTALVSYVLNGKEEKARVGKDIADKIRQKAKELNYQPNQIAKSLKSGKTNTIGVIIADISNPFFSNIARMIEDEAKKHHYTVIFGSSDENPEKLYDLIDVFLKRQVDGLIIVPTNGSEPHIQQLYQNNFPLVLIDRYYPTLPTHYIAVNNYEASLQAINHLVENGYRQIAMIAYDVKLIHMQERERGYFDALKSHDLFPEPSLLKEVQHQNLEENVYERIKEAIYIDKADAIFFATNSLATSGLRAINTLRIKIPDQLGIVTFDESEAFDFFYSPLTFIRQPVAALAKEAVRVVLDQLTEKTFDNPQQISLPAELIVRDSSRSGLHKSIKPNYKPIL